MLGMTGGTIVQALLRDNNIVHLRHIMVIEKRHMLHILMLTLAMVSTIQILLDDSEVEWQKNHQAQTLMTAADQVATVTINLTLASVDPPS